MGRVETAIGRRIIAKCDNTKRTETVSKSYDNLGLTEQGENKDKIIKGTGDWNLVYTV